MNKRIVFPLGLLLLFLFLDLFYTRGIGLFGDAMDSNVFQHFRLPRVLGAVFAGISLGISGLALQTLFRNPLAGPFLTGITPGASLGIALLLLGIPAGMSLGDAFFFSMSGAGLLGGMLVLLLQLYINKRHGGIFTLLLSGVMLGYLAGAVTDMLQTLAQAEKVKSFVMWGMGNFDRVQRDQLLWFGASSVAGAIAILLMRYKLDAWLPGEMYAQNSGINTQKLRWQIVLICGLLAGTTTAFCGPIGFVGLAAPHLSRMTVQRGMHGQLWLPTMIWGMLFCVFADFLAHNLFEHITLNVNSICALAGAPIVLWILLKRGGFAKNM